MTDLLLAAIDLAAQPVALVGYLVLGVWARSALRAIAGAAGWALVMQIFVTVTGGGFVAPAALAIQFALRLAGAIVLTLAIWLLDRALRGGAGPRRGGPRGSRGGGRAQRSSRLRRVR